MCKKLLSMLLFLIIVLTPRFVFATQISDNVEYEDLLNDSGARELFDYLTPQSEDMLTDMGIADMDYNSILHLDFPSIWEGVSTNISDVFSLPLTMFTSVVAVILIAGVLTSLLGSKNNLSTFTAFSMVQVLTLSGVIVPSILSLIEFTRSLTTQIGEFMGAFVPIFAGIISVSGKPISAFTYSGILLGTIQVMNFFINYAIFPMIGIYFAFSIVSYATGIGDLQSVSNTVKSVMLWALGLILTIFVGMLTIRSFVASSADSVTLRASKYVVGSFVPIVGGAISESIGVLQGSLSLIKSTVGAFGIIAIIVTIIPAVISILATMMVFKLSKLASDIFSNKLISSFLDSASFVLTLLMSIIICYALMLIISTSLILALGVSA